MSGEGLRKDLDLLGLTLPLLDWGIAMCKLDRNVARTWAGRVKTRARQAFVVLMGILLVSQTIFSWAGPVFAEEIVQAEEQRAWSRGG